MLLSFQSGLHCMTILHDKILRPNDSIPMSGSRVWSHLLTDVQKLAEQIDASLPNLADMLPPSLWPDTRAAVRIVEAQMKAISQSHYVRIVDNGMGAL